MVFSESKGSEWAERVLNAGGALTWSVALKQDTPASNGMPEIPGGFLMKEAQVKLIKRIHYNRGKQLHLKLDGKSNGKTFDTSPNKYKADAGSTVFSQDPIRGYVANFNHSPIKVTGYKGIAGDGARSVGLWIKTSSSTGKIVQWGSNSQGKRWWLQLSNGKLAVLIHGASTEGSKIINDDQWHHVAVTSTNSTFSNVKIYVDGVLDNLSTFNNASNVSINTAVGDDVLIGKDFIGKLDDIVIHSNALTFGNIAYAASADASEDIELAVKLRLDEVSGDPKVIDDSIYERNGAILNTDLGVVDPIRGTVAFFDGNSHIELAPDTDLTIRASTINGYNGIPGEEPRTIMGWVKTITNEGDLVQYGNYSPVNREFWRMGIVNNKLRLNIKGGTVNASTIITDDQWHHFALVASDNQLSNVKIYIDGELESTTLGGIESTFDTHTLNSIYDRESDILTLESKNVRLGRGGFVGYLDDVILHQRALSQYEIKNMAGL